MEQPATIIIAPDKFKGTFTAAEICRRLAPVVAARHPGCRVIAMPMADGGEGTALLLRARFGLPAIDSADVIGVNAPAGKLPSEAMRRSSFPLGSEILRVARTATESTLYVGIGGTLTTDGGAGLLQALGARFYDKEGEQLVRPICADDLADLSRCELPDAFIPSTLRLVALSDVDVPLVPPTDRTDALSTLSFAPQKGVTAAQMPRLRQGLAKLLKLLTDAGARIPAHYCGSGGGIGLALQIAGAEGLPGAETIWSHQLEAAKVQPSEIAHIYTGEGALDRQSFTGKVTGTIIAYGRKHDIPVTVVCGRNDLQRADLPAGVEVTTLAEFTVSGL